MFKTQGHEMGVHGRVVFIAWRRGSKSAHLVWEVKWLGHMGRGSFGAHLHFVAHHKH